MLIKNTNDRAVNIEMKTRDISLNPGEEKFITAEEVRDDQLRAKLQVRAVSIVRPSTEAEEVELMKEIDALTSQQDEVSHTLTSGVYKLGKLDSIHWSDQGAEPMHIVGFGETKHFTIQDQEF